MIYSKIDVAFQRKRRALKAGRDAQHLWYFAHHYVTEELPDEEGLFPTEALQLYPFEDRAALAAKLVEVGLWLDHPSGWAIFNFVEKEGQTKEIVIDRRAKDRVRKGKASPPASGPVSSPPIEDPSVRIPRGIPSSSSSSSDQEGVQREGKRKRPPKDDPRQLHIRGAIGALRIAPPAATLDAKDGIAGALAALTPVGLVPVAMRAPPDAPLEAWHLAGSARRPEQLAASGDRPP